MKISFNDISTGNWVILIVHCQRLLTDFFQYQEYVRQYPGGKLNKSYKKKKIPEQGIGDVLNEFHVFLSKNKELFGNKRYFKVEGINFAAQYFVNLHKNKKFYTDFYDADFGIKEGLGAAEIKADHFDLMYKNFIVVMVLEIAYGNLEDFIRLLSRELKKSQSEMFIWLEQYKNTYLFDIGCIDGSFIEKINSDLLQYLATRKRIAAKMKEKDRKIFKRQEIIKKLIKEIDPKGIMKKYPVADQILKELPNHLHESESPKHRDTIATDLKKLGIYD